MSVVVSFDLSRIDRYLTDLQRVRVPIATTRALNTTAFAVKRAIEDDMKAKFDRATPYTLRGFIVDRAGEAPKTVPSNGAPTPAFKRTGSATEARVYLNTDVNKSSLSRLDTIGHQFVGGQAKFTGFERALNRIGVLPRGWQIVPATATPTNQYGNVSPGLVIQLISYFGAFGEQGYKANATDKSRARRSKKTRGKSGFLKINGVEYFISRGPGEVVGRGTWKSGRYQHLAPGIWSRRGTHGVDITPVFLFVRTTTYRQRIDVPAIVRRMNAAALLQSEFLRVLRLK